MQGVIVRIALGVFGLLTVAMLLLAVFNDKGALKVHARANKLTAIESEIVTLDSENKQLSHDKSLRAFMNLCDLKPILLARRVFCGGR